MIEAALYVPRPASDISRAIAGVLGRNWLDYLAMPELCRFLGMIITMYYDDHAPPHFHIRYGDYKAIMGIDSLMLLDGYLPPRALGLVAEWGALHRDELWEDWSLAEQRAPLKKIKPLE